MLHAFASMRCVAILTIAGVVGLVAAASPMERASAATRDRGPQWDEIAQSRSVGTPVMAIVSLKEQRVTIYDDEGPILRSSVSTGQTGYETPVGIYSVLQKEAEIIPIVMTMPPCPSCSGLPGRVSRCTRARCPAIPPLTAASACHMNSPSIYSI